MLENSWPVVGEKGRQFYLLALWKYITRNAEGDFPI
tara:strand:- start:2299 stop:2406 length:108 start_codon:yes stop_codon:yes gene_type:complete